MAARLVPVIANPLKAGGELTGSDWQELRVARIITPQRGAVAQLGERRVRNAKVGSSILLGSTKFPNYCRCP